MITALILSGGTGTRMKANGIPKQYLLLRGRPMLSYSLCVFDRHPAIDKLVVMADKVWREQILKWMQKDAISKFVAFADPGPLVNFLFSMG